jgi:hypothetical protein
MSLVDDLKTSAKNALTRGFAILTVESEEKKPWAKYSPNAVNSATRNPEIALKAWNDGEPANYGVACGQSNLTVVDCDHGLNSIEELYTWMNQNNIPETFIVQSGRDGEAGFHLYFTGAVPTCGFKIGHVTGEFKGYGGYVVGQGSVHPSGKKYVIVKDVPIAPLPEGLRAISTDATKKPLNFKPASETGELIKAGTRWLHLQSKAGTFRNAGLDRDGIYAALKNFCVNNCEDGDNYPDEKIQALADAAVTKFDAQSTAVVYFGDTKKIDTSLPEVPSETIDGDWIGEMSHIVSDGTFIPPSFARSQIKTILASAIDGLVGYPGQEDLHTRQWNMMISSNPESGKGESWKRTGEFCLHTFIHKVGLGLPKAGWFSSGEHMIKKLVEEGYEDKNVLVYFDELAMLFSKGGAQNSTLFNHLTSMYDRTDGSAGSLSNSGGSFNNISISFTGGFTRSSFEASVTGRGAGGDGFLSRCVLTYSGPVKHIGDWPEIDTVKSNALEQKMIARYSEIQEQHSKNNQPAKEGETKKPWRFVPKETPEAKTARDEFEKQLRARSNVLNENHPEMGYASRLFSHFKRDVLLRTIFSEDPTTITKQSVELAGKWAEHQLMLREEMWPAGDKGNQVERMEQSIRKALLKHEHLTKARLQTACNMHRSGSGGVTVFNMAWKAMLYGEVVDVVGKTHKGTEVFGLVNTEKDEG